MPQQLADQAVQQHGDAHQKHQRPHREDQPNGLHREGRNAVHGKGDHLLQRILRLPRKALPAGVGHGVALEAHQRDNAPQEKIHLAELLQRLHRPAAHQPIIRMVIHDIHAHGLHEPIKALRRHALEGRVRLALGAHAVHHLAPAAVFFQHCVHGVDVVLQVRVHGNNHVRVLRRLGQPRQQRILVPAVAAQLHAGKHGRVLLMQPRNDLPCAILGTVIDE